MRRPAYDSERQGATSRNCETYGLLAQQRNLLATDTPVSTANHFTDAHAIVADLPGGWIQGHSGALYTIPLSLSPSYVVGSSAPAASLATLFASRSPSFAALSASRPLSSV